jgi:MraZ protein
MTEFSGSYSGTLDAKNRLHLPARLRQAADGSLDACYLTLGLGGVLYLLPKIEWRRLATRLESYSQSNSEEGPAVYRVFFAYTFEVSLDRQSRIQVPQELVSKVGLPKDVRILGRHRRVEIWPAEKFDDRIQQDEKTYEEKAAQLFQ